ncbi:hypothetical protein JTB14_036471 [Gonioctena quinquepunctata]|nr:hypothetical protein JTB14_036471 [Gonioctena quinquepunctata]
MAKAAGGRGRGWLNLSKNQGAPNNFSVPMVPPLIGNTNHINPSVIDDNQFVDAVEYIDLINVVKELNISDDGIKFNQKMKYILEKWKEDCKTGDDVEKSFEKIYQASSLSCFEGSKLLQNTNPIGFRNSVRILGEFFNKARLANGEPFTFMATPLVSYLEMLLESAQPQDIQLFTSQLYLNGSSIKAESPEKLTDLLNSVRLLLVSNEKLSTESKLWLLLSLDGANNRFGLLPTELYKFYQNHIGEAAMANFQGTPSILSVQTSQDNKTLDSYQSNVNVLQVTSPVDTSNDHSSQFPSSDSLNTSQGFTGSSGFLSDASSQNSSTNFRDSNSGKHGRPILGAGARLNKNKMNNESTSNWRDGSGWGSKPKGGWGDNKKGPKTSKGWEHDDRFENDYS